MPSFLNGGYRWFLPEADSVRDLRSSSAFTRHKPQGQTSDLRYPKIRLILEPDSCVDREHPQGGCQEAVMSLGVEGRVDFGYILSEAFSTSCY